MNTTAYTLMLMATMTASACAQASVRFAITPEQVACALSQAGVVTAAQQVSLPARVVANEPTPVLEIVSIEARGKTKSPGHDPPPSKVKLTCHLPGQCLPFYALVNWPREKGLTTSYAGNQAVITMRAGTRATLVMDDQRSHIQVAVISLQNGAVGNRIRVASPDHKQFYFGEVLSPTLLRGSF
jgi:hypothetical protein